MPAAIRHKNASTWHESVHRQRQGRRPAPPPAVLNAARLPCQQPFSANPLIWTTKRVSCAPAAIPASPDACRTGIAGLRGLSKRRQDLHLSGYKGCATTLRSQAWVIAAGLQRNARAQDRRLAASPVRDAGDCNHGAGQRPGIPARLGHRPRQRG